MGYIGGRVTSQNSDRLCEAMKRTSLILAVPAALVVGFAHPAKGLPPIADAGAHRLERPVVTVRARKAAARRGRQRQDMPSVPPRTEGQSPAGRVSAISPPAKENDPHAGAPRAPDPAGRDAIGTTPQTPEAAPPRWSDAEVISGLRQCLRLLAPMTTSIDILEPLRNGECGAPVPIRLKRIGATGGVDVDPPAVVNCQLIARMHDWIGGTLQPAAERLLGSRITRIVIASSYDCRNRIGSASVRTSEHAFANAIDVGAVITADGRSIDVLSHWGPTARDLRAQQLARAADRPEDRKSAATEESTKTPERGRGRKEASSSARASAHRKSMTDATPVAQPRTREAEFLRAVHAGACGVFSTVLGPEANEAHRNHLHFDLIPRRHKALCE
jgi:hypothetical protein